MHMVATEVCMTTSMTTPLSRYSACLCEWPRSLIHHSPLQKTCMVLLLNSHFVLSVWFLSTLNRLASGGPLMAKRTIYGSHTCSGGTIYGNIICRSWSEGDQLWRGTNCGVTGAVTAHFRQESQYPDRKGLIYLYIRL